MLNNNSFEATSIYQPEIIDVLFSVLIPRQELTLLSLESIDS